MIIPNNPLIENKAILDYIPQRGHYVFVDTYYGILEESAYSSLFLGQETIFVENGLFTDVGLVEFLAQSGFLHFGYYDKNSLSYEKKYEARKGYICKIKDCSFNSFPSIGNRIYSKLDLTFKTDAFSSIFMTAYNETTIFAQGIFDVVTF